MYYLYKCKICFYTEVKIHSSIRQDYYLNVTWMNHIIKLVLENRVSSKLLYLIYCLFPFLTTILSTHMAKLQPVATYRCTISWNHISVHATPSFFKTQIASTCFASTLPLQSSCNLSVDMCQDLSQALGMS